jgi:hypothetical protein
MCVCVVCLGMDRVRHQHPRGDAGGGLQESGQAGGSSGQVFTILVAHHNASIHLVRRSEGPAPEPGPSEWLLQGLRHRGIHLREGRG